MPRYILIDRATGHIFGDTADFAANADLDPLDAARLLDEGIREHGHLYVYVPRLDHDVTYDVYRADIGGSEAVGAITDGQSREMIDAVERDCLHVVSIRRMRRAA